MVLSVGMVLSGLVKASIIVRAAETAKKVLFMGTYECAPPKEHFDGRLTRPRAKCQQELCALRGCVKIRFSYSWYFASLHYICPIHASCINCVLYCTSQTKTSRDVKDSH